ncbi:MAG: ice-binding family protein [Chitinispirillaceae bacterium]|nr:ice-binding family protein [Chitinispirillaceae bacterium]
MKTAPYFAALAVALTAPIAALALAPVNLGTAGNFVILAKTGISTTGTTAITGDLGVSPAAATFITGFSLIADATNTFSRSSLVTGKIYAADYTAPTPTAMTTAILDMETAYTDAAGRTTPDFTELHTGDLTGKTLIPGLYKWGTSVIISAGGTTIAGSPSDIWIFQIAGDLTLANAAIVTLSGGAQAKNIFWQVAGQVTVGTTAQMKGIILCQTLIDLQTGSTLNGRALAQTAVTSDASIVVMPAIATSVITFDTLIHKKTGDARFKLTATASSGLPVSYTLSNTTVATISGDTITILGVGTDTITASQAGNENYSAAVPVKRVLTVTDGTPVVTGRNGELLSGRNCFGVVRGNRIGVNAGPYEIAVYDLTGRIIFQQKATANAGFIKMAVPEKTSNVLIVRLTQGDRSMVRKIQTVR